jgi:hypothetical protein
LAKFVVELRFMRVANVVGNLADVLVGGGQHADGVPQAQCATEFSEPEARRGVQQPTQMGARHTNGAPVLPLGQVQAAAVGRSKPRESLLYPPITARFVAGGVALRE